MIKRDGITFEHVNTDDALSVGPNIRLAAAEPVLEKLGLIA